MYLTGQSDERRGLFLPVLMSSPYDLHVSAGINSPHFRRIPPGYVNPQAPSFLDMLNMTDQPLATLPDSVTRTGQGSARSGDGRAEIGLRLFHERIRSPTAKPLRMGQ